MLFTSSSESFSLLFWIDATAFVQEDWSRSFASTRTSRRFRYVPRVGSPTNGSATELNSRRRSTLSSKASQLAGVAFGACVIFSSQENLNLRSAPAGVTYPDGSRDRNVLTTFGSNSRPA